VRLAVAVLVSLWIAPALADLYRWVDPETGTVKFSSYPPPWFNDAASQGRAPKVEVIRPSRQAPAFAPETDGGPGQKAAEGGVGRDALVKQVAQRVAALASAPPEAMGQAYAELAEPLQQLERLDRQQKPSNPGDEGVRFEEKAKLAAPLEARRSALLQQLSALSPPPPGSPADRIESAWAGTQRWLAALGFIDGAIISMDPRKANARHFEMNALIDKVVAQWEPYVDPSIVRKNRGR
jgi:hypothetical protein